LLELFSRWAKVTDQSSHASFENVSQELTGGAAVEDAEAAAGYLLNF